MGPFELLLIMIFAIAISLLAIRWIRSRKPNKDIEDQRELDTYLKGPFSLFEIGRLYERYIGHLYELEGYDVQFHGAVNGFTDMGRDLVVSNRSEIIIVQAKCWAKFKTIKENHIFQLYGSMAHFKLTSKKKRPHTKAVFFTTAKFSKTAKAVAQVLGVELRNEELKTPYPMIKCNISANGEKIYHLPVDPYYDKVKIHLKNGECYASTVEEAVAKGFRRAKKHSKAA